MGKTKKEGVTIVNVRGDEAVEQNGGGAGWQEGSATVYIAKKEVCRPRHIINVGLERECCLRGGGSCQFLLRNCQFRHVEIQHA